MVGGVLQGRDQTLLTLSTRQLPGQSVRSQTDLRPGGFGGGRGDFVFWDNFNILPTTTSGPIQHCKQESYSSAVLSHQSEEASLW